MANLTKDNVVSLLYERSLWWCLGDNGSNVALTLSEQLECKLGVAIMTCDDFVSYMSDESAHHFMRHTQAMMEGKVSNDHFLISLKGNDGKLIWLMNELHYSQRGGDEFICATCIDVTEMHELEEKLIATNSDLMIENLQEKERRSKEENEHLYQQYRDQTKFLAMLSHELRTPLMGVSSLIGVIRQNQIKGQSIDEPLRIMKLTIDQLNFLINDILTYSQTESEHIQINPIAFSINEMAEYVSHLTRSIANDKGVSVSISLKTRSAVFYGDLLRISQILINLIVNAIKFTQQGGVFLEVEETERGLLFRVTDSGEGIEASQLETIFEPFKQLESKGSQQYFGSGLGLPIVNRLVELLGGEITIESTKGLGTTFCVELPVSTQTHFIKGVSEDRGDASLNKKQKLIDLHEPLRVLIADDSVINRKVLEIFLLEINCRVEHAENGQQAWDKFLEQDFDFVFLDIQMPVLNGVDVCKKIRLLGAGLKPRLKGIYALTAAHTEEEVAKMGIEIDKEIFDEWIEKPISQDKVLGVLYKELIEREEMSKKPLAAVVPEPLAHLLPQFIESTTKDLKRLDNLILVDDEVAFRQACHLLKGNLMLFEVEDMLSVMREVESLNFFSQKEVIKERLEALNNIFNGFVLTNQ